MRLPVGTSHNNVSIETEEDKGTDLTRLNKISKKQKTTFLSELGLGLCYEDSSGYNDGGWDDSFETESMDDHNGDSEVAEDVSLFKNIPAFS